jgi:hypothetical protein
MDIITNAVIHLVRPNSQALATHFLRRRSMKFVKSLVLAALLVSTLAFNTFAGDIETPGYTAPPPPPRAMTTIDEPTTTSSSSTTQQDGGITAETSEFLIFGALTALLSVY